MSPEREGQKSHLRASIPTARNWEPTFAYVAARSFLRRTGNIIRGAVGRVFLKRIKTIFFFWMTSLTVGIVLKFVVKTVMLIWGISLRMAPLRRASVIVLTLSP